MRKRVILISLAILAAILVILGALFIDRGDTKQVIEKIGDSDLFTAEEIESAMAAVKKEFRKSFRDCTLTKLWYDENVCKLELEDWKTQYQADDAIVLLSDFEVGRSTGDQSLKAGSAYKNWEWILVRNADGEWKVKTWGY